MNNKTTRPTGLRRAQTDKGRRQFLRRVRNLALGAGAYPLLAALIADRAWAAVPPCEVPYHCWDPYHWYCDNYYDEGCAAPPHYCTDKFHCDASVICDATFQCGDVPNAYGCTDRDFTCQGDFTCNRRIGQFNCGGGDHEFNCDPQSNYHNQCP